MTFALRLLTLAGASSLALSGAALADPARPIALGQTVNGSLGAGDARTSDGAAYEEFTVRLAADQSIEAVMSSSAFDAFLHVGRGSGDAFENLKNDDDRAGGEKGTDARVRFKAPQAGVYTLRARALSGEMSGAYALALTSYTAPPPAVPRDAAYGDTVSGRLANGGPRLEDSDRLYDEYRFTAAVGDRVKLDSVSDEFDSMIDLGMIKDGAFESLKSDDDGGGDKNARLLTVIETAGVYTVRVSSFDRNGGGAYTFSATKLPPAAPAPRPITMRRNQIMKGTLGDASATFDEFRPYNYYTLSGRAGEKVTITMRASFDSYLDVGVMSPGGFAVIQGDDDSGGETNAKVDFTFQETGRILIRASALRAGMSGEYSLSVE